MADTKLTALAADATPGTDSLIYTVDDPGGAPLSRKTSLGQAYIRYVAIEIVDKDTLLTTGNGKKYIHIPPGINGMNLVYVHAHALTASAVGIPTFQVHNLTDVQDMLSTLLTIDATETDSSTAVNAAVIDAAHDDVATNDVIQIDCDVAGDTTKGVVITLGFRMP